MTDVAISAAEQALERETCKSIADFLDARCFPESEEVCDDDYDESEQV